jgi:hypothetical protein
MAEHEHEASTNVEFHQHKLSGWFRYVPVFLYILILYLVGKAAIHDPRAALFSIGAYQLSWVEVLYLGASIVALIEQLKVSHPGIDNTLEALLMLGFGVLQLILFILGAAGVKGCAVFNNTEFLMLMVISVAAAVIAVLINARTLRRTMALGDN